MIHSTGDNGTYKTKEELKDPAWYEELNRWCHFNPFEDCPDIGGKQGPSPSDSSSQEIETFLMEEDVGPPWDGKTPSEKKKKKKKKTPVAYDGAAPLVAEIPSSSGQASFMSPKIYLLLGGALLGGAWYFNRRK